VCVCVVVVVVVVGRQEALDHLASFPSSREMISQPGIGPPTTPFSFGTFPLSSGSLGSSRQLLLKFHGVATTVALEVYS
jgi:hypothetical protein